MVDSETYINRSTNLIKQANTHKIRLAMAKNNSVTKPQLSRITGLSVITVNSLVKALLDTGEIIEMGRTTPKTGRPAALFSINKNFYQILIVYILEFEKNEAVYYHICDRTGATLEVYHKPVSEVGLNTFDNTIRIILNKYPFIKIIGFGLPVAESSKKIISSDYPKLIGTHFCEHIENKFNISCFVMKDIFAATYGYYHTQAEESEKNVVGIFFPHRYPPGAGFIQDGKLIVGRNGLLGRVDLMSGPTNWNHLAANKEDLIDAFIDIIRKTICLYNPDTIVIYTSLDYELVIKGIDSILVSQVEQLMLPRIVKRESMEEDYLLGLKQLALSKMMEYLY